MFIVHGTDMDANRMFTDSNHV